MCHQTDLWRRYNAGVEEACEKNSFTVPYFQPDGVNVIIFINLFCYVCNTNDVPSAEMNCPGMMMDNRYTFTDFNALIDVNGRKVDQMASLHM